MTLCAHYYSLQRLQYKLLDVINHDTIKKEITHQSPHAEPCPTEGTGASELDQWKMFSHESQIHLDVDGLVYKCSNRVCCQSLIIGITARL